MELVNIEDGNLTISVHWTEAARLAEACAGRADTHFDLLSLALEGAAFAGYVQMANTATEDVSMAGWRAKQAGTQQTASTEDARRLADVLFEDGP